MAYLIRNESMITRDDCMSAIKALGEETSRQIKTLNGIVSTMVGLLGTATNEIRDLKREVHSLTLQPPMS